MYPDLESALGWAYFEKAKLLIDSSGANKLCWKYTPSSYVNELLIGLNKDERLKQAVNIVGMVNELDAIDPSYKELVRAEFGYEREDKKMATLMLKIMGMLGTGTHRRRGIRDIVLTYFKVNIGDREIRQNLRCNMNDVHSYKTKVCDSLDIIRSRSLGILHGRFVEKGLIASQNQTVASGK